MSVWPLIVSVVVAWTVVSVGFGLFLGRVAASQRRGGYIDINQRTVDELDPSGERVKLALRIRDEGQSAA